MIYLELASSILIVDILSSDKNQTPLSALADSCEHLWTDIKLWFSHNKSWLNVHSKYGIYNPNTVRSTITWEHNGFMVWDQPLFSDREKGVRDLESLWRFSDHPENLDVNRHLTINYIGGVHPSFDHTAFGDFFQALGASLSFGKTVEFVISHKETLDSRLQAGIARALHDDFLWNIHGKGMKYGKEDDSDNEDEDGEDNEPPDYFTPCPCIGSQDPELCRYNDLEFSISAVVNH
jgi:hypothetical protein